MRLHWTWLSLVVLLSCAGGALAQRQGVAVQLPTFSYFTVNTTVSVPDRGSAYLGGVDGAASGRYEFGVPMLPFRPFRNTAIGGQWSASNVHVTATIHDFAAMDEYLLGQPTPFSQSLTAAYFPSVAGLADVPPPRNPTRGNSWEPALPDRSGVLATMSVAEARADRLRQRETRAAEAEDFFRRGQQAEAAGNSGAAKVYYQMAARRATGDLESQVLARLKAIAHTQTALNVAGQQR
jgi:hypothetical protein